MVAVASTPVRKLTLADVRRLDSPEKRWPRTEYAVEGDDFGVWKTWGQHLKWDQCHGWLVTIGEVFIGVDRKKLEKMPVSLLLSWVLIEGHLVCIYEVSSQVVDHRLVDDYIEKNCKRTACGATFYDVLHYFGLPVPDLR